MNVSAGCCRCQRQICKNETNAQNTRRELATAIALHDLIAKYSFSHSFAFYFQVSLYVLALCRCVFYTFMQKDTNRQLGKAISETDAHKIFGSHVYRYEHGATYIAAICVSISFLFLFFVAQRAMFIDGSSRAQ